MSNPLILTLNLILLVLLMGCMKGEPVAHPNQSTKQINPPDFLEPQTETTISDPEQLKAWRHFAKVNHYRIANVSDFDFSESNGPRHAPYWYGSGDFNRDEKYSDFALIIVDVTRNDPLRFGLIIFNAKADGYEDPIWLYRDSDLSKTSLNTTSHGPLMIAKHGMNQVDICTVKWRSKQKGYKCD